MKEIILLKSGEIALKGDNRSKFEDRLIRNAKARLETLGGFEFSKAQSTIYARPTQECDLDEAVERLSKVFGFAGISRARVVEKDFEKIKETTVAYLGDRLRQARTFKVAAKRSDKTFRPASPELCRELGSHLLAHFPHLKVDVRNPDVLVVVEVRDFAAYIHEQQLPGAGGMPVGSSGRSVLLLSGGIDSPVAGYMMAKRGLKVHALHFVSPPYTSERAQLKVETLCEKMSHYCGRTRLGLVPFTKIQEEIKKHCREEYFVLIMRRFMMEIAQRIAVRNGCGSLITGESVGQVASQTVAAMTVTGAGIDLPIFRPVVGLDKEEIVNISRKIDTYETSILPYEDCCTVFTPRHPKTNPKLADILQAEQALDREALIAEAVEGTTYTAIG